MLRIAISVAAVIALVAGVLMTPFAISIKAGRVSVATGQTVLDQRQHELVVNHVRRMRFAYHKKVGLCFMVMPSSDTWNVQIPTFPVPCENVRDIAIVVE